MMVSEHGIIATTVLHGQAQKRCDHRFIGIARGRKGLLLPLLNLKIFARKIGKKDDCHYLTTLEKDR